MTNAELAYLLGMVAGKGTIKRDSDTTTVLIEIPHKNLLVEGKDAQLSINASLNEFRNIIQPLIGVHVITSQQRSKTIIKFTKINEDLLIREINRHFEEKNSWKEFRIPKDIFNSSSDIKREFLIGLSDVTAHIGHGGEAFGKSYAHRVYVEIPVNWYLATDICNLLRDLNVPVHNIDWGHPNMRDPNLVHYNKGNKMFWNKEHQIKVFAELYEKIGFRIIHKMQILRDLAQANKDEWDKDRRGKIEKTKSTNLRQRFHGQLGGIEKEHNKFYWQVKSRIKENRPKHPMENCEILPPEIRGRHFNHWTEIAAILGYAEKKHG